MSDIFAKRLKELRKEKNYSHEELAAAVKISYFTLRNYENAAFDPRMPALIQLAKFFKVSTDYLLGLTNKRG